MQAYAVDAPLCPNGAPHQPKYDHLTAMHAALADAAPSILASDAQLWNGVALEWYDWGFESKAHSSNLKFERRPLNFELQSTVQAKSDQY